MRFCPHDYQKYAIDFILDHPIAAVILDMGLGKTSITLTAIEQLIHDRFEVSHVLVIAPLRVAMMTWPEELQRWDHLHSLTFAVAVGTEQERRTALFSRANITIINRENVDWLVNRSHVPLYYDMVVFDELSSFKNWQSQRFKAFMKLRPSVKRVVGLTGTPSPNGLMDLFAEYRCLDMGARLGRFIGRYRAEYFYPAKTNGNIVYSYALRPGAEEQIYQKISDITLSMKALDHIPMPELISNRCVVRMNAEEKKLYEQLKKDLIIKINSEPSASGSELKRTSSGATEPSSFLTEANGCEACEDAVTATNAASLANKLSQLANGCVYNVAREPVVFHDRKLDALEDLLEAATGPVLICYWFRHDLQRITERLDKLGIHWATIREPDDIRRWNAGELPVGLIHPGSAGHGLNLQQGGHTMIWFGLTWSLELYEQCIARLWRQGQQSETVIVTHIVTENTIDERILKALESKSQTQEALISAVRAEITNQFEEEPNKVGLLRERRSSLVDEHSDARETRDDPCLTFLTLQGSE